MGVRQYHEKILLPEMTQKIHKIEELYDVTDKLEYIQYMNTVDKKPPNMGGRNNSWRELAVTQYGDQHIVYDEKARNIKKRKPVAQPKIETVKINVSLPANPAHQPDYNMDDDFGILLDWATNLDEANLGDYEVEVH
ncbi:hypothetical protein HDV01_001543 [Terramyces sp. JEL0728]|nr:hypothetical protein HDV01_001543 [Terramyces sp. JEL0728]